MRPEAPLGGTSAPDGGRLNGRPALCLITDRRRLTTALGVPAANWREPLLAQITAALAGGIDVVQIRERDLDDRILVAVVRDCVRAARDRIGRVVLNDRVDIAVAGGAHGVHLREDGILTAPARRLAPAAFLIGRSVHGAPAAAASSSADYLIAGPVFETRSKPGQAGQGLGAFQAIAAAAPCPVWAVGGIALLHVPALVRAGAGGVAAIGAFIPDVTGRDLATAVQKVVEEFRFAFDSPSWLS